MNEMDKAVESFKSALEQAKNLYPGQPCVAYILNCLGKAALQDRKLHESLRYFQEAKEILVNNSEVGILTSTILHNIGICYVELDELLLAFQSFKDALDNLDITMISGEVRYFRLCENIAEAVMELSVPSIIQTSVFNQSKQRKPVERDEKRPLTKDTCPDIVNNRYQLSLSCKFHGEQDKVLKHLEEAREIAKRFDYKCGRMVLVLLLLSMTYGEMWSFDKSRSCYKEAKEMAKSLPPVDDSILPGELGMIESMKKE